jgi:hypothetical protein
MIAEWWGLYFAWRNYKTLFSLHVFIFGFVLKYLTNRSIEFDRRRVEMENKSSEVVGKERSCKRNKGLSSHCSNFHGYPTGVTNSYVQGLQNIICTTNST